MSVIVSVFNIVCRTELLVSFIFNPFNRKEREGNSLSCFVPLSCNELVKYKMIVEKQYYKDYLQSTSLELLRHDKN